MSLVLRGIALNDEPMTRPLMGRFDERGGTLGRSDSVTFTLPDPERMISRVQAQILHRDEGYWIENVSATASILHNGRPLSPGMRVLLREDDELRIGGYTLQAAFEQDETSALILRGRAAARRPKVLMPQSALDSPIATPLTLPAAAPTATGAKPEPTFSQTAEGELAPKPAADPSAAGGEELWRAFIQGAGLEGLLAHEPSREVMAEIGTMMRIAVDGLRRLVALRTAATDEMQAHMTVTQVRSNNPLQFAPDATAALQLLLQPPARGSLRGPAALRCALNDLYSHQVGVNAGTRAALQALLERFDPQQLEALLASRSVFGVRLPRQRPARLWEMYLEHYRALRVEAEENFQRLFGEAFRAAYEAEISTFEAAEATPRSAEPKSEEGPS